MRCFYCGRTIKGMGNTCSVTGKDYCDNCIEKAREELKLMKDKAYRFYRSMPEIKTTEEYNDYVLGLTMAICLDFPRSNGWILNLQGIHLQFLEGLKRAFVDAEKIEEAYIGIVTGEVVSEVIVKRPIPNCIMIWAEAVCVPWEIL